jgi:hypothetical protein
MTALYDEKGVVLSLYSDKPALDGILDMDKQLAKEFRRVIIKEPNSVPKISLVSALQKADGLKPFIPEATEIVAYHGAITDPPSDHSKDRLQDTPCWIIIIGGADASPLFAPGAPTIDNAYCDTLVIVDSNTGRLIEYVTVGMYPRGVKLR